MEVDVQKMQEQGKALDLTSGKWVDSGKPTNLPDNGSDPDQSKPDPDTTDPNPETKKDETSTDPATAKPDDNQPGASDKPDTVGDQTKKEEPKPEDKLKEEPKSTEAKFEPGDYIKEKFAEKYGLETEAELDEVLSQTNEVLDMYKKLQQEHEDLKKAGPQFRSEQEKKIFEFLKPFDPNRFGEGLNTAASIMGMDPASAGENQVLLESFVLKHPDLTREEAQLLFEDEHSKKYSINKDDFDSEADFTKRKSILDIQRKNEVAQARKELAAKKQELMAPKEELKKEEAPKADTKTQAASSVDPKVSAPYVKELETFMRPGPNKVFDRINYMQPDGKTVRFSLLLDPEKRDFVEKNIKEYLNRADIYDKNGKIIDKFEPLDLVKTFLRVGYGDWMEENILNAAETIAKGLKAEQIANLKPDKTSSGGGDAKLSIEAQLEIMAKKAVEERNAKKR